MIIRDCRIITQNILDRIAIIRTIVEIGRHLGRSCGGRHNGSVTETNLFIRVGPSRIVFPIPLVVQVEVPRKALQRRDSRIERSVEVRLLLLSVLPVQESPDGVGGSRFFGSFRITVSTVPFRIQARRRLAQVVVGVIEVSRLLVFLRSKRSRSDRQPIRHLCLDVGTQRIFLDTGIFNQTGVIQIAGRHQHADLV